MTSATTKQTGIIAWFASNHVAANLLMLVIIGAGLMSAQTIRKQTLPNFESSTISVTVPYRGAAPQEVEEGVVIKIEEAIQDIDEIEDIRSSSSEGVGRVYAEVRDPEDVEETLNEIKSRVDSISTFPGLTEKPTIRLASRMILQVMIISIYGDIDEFERKTLAQEIGDELVLLDEVSEVAFFGDRAFEINIEVSEQTLRKYGLTMSDISQAIRNSSVDLPGGSIRSDGGDILLRTKGTAYTGVDFGQIVLRTFSDGTRLTLADIAEIRDGFVEDKPIARHNGEESISVRVMTSDRINELETSEMVREYVARKQAELPEGVKLDVWADLSPNLIDRLNLMIKNMAFGALLVFMMLALFLRGKVAGWVIVGIPVTFLGALWLMPAMWTPVTINMISLFGFIMVLGIVVDDAIIIGESIYTQVRKDGHSLDSVITGTRRVALPATFGVLTTIAAFAPLMLYEGPGSSFIFPMAAVIVLCLGFSLVESKLILPAHLAAARIPEVDEDDLFNPQRPIPLRERPSRFFLKINRRTQHALHRFVDNIYRPALHRALDYRGIVLTVFVGVLIVSAGLIAGGHIKLAFFPEAPGDRIQVSVDMREGTSRAERDAAILQIEAAISDLNNEYNTANPDEPPYVTTIASFATGGSGALIFAETPKDIVRDFDANDVIAEWRERVGEIPVVKDLDFSFGISFGGGAPISFRLNGDNIDMLQAASRELQLKLAEYEGVFDIINSSTSGGQEIRLNIKPEAEALGLTMSSLGRQVRQAFYGEEAQRIQRGKNEIRVMVRYPESERRSVADLENMLIRTPGGDEVPFSSVADVEYGSSYSSISRLNRTRTVTVSADIVPEIANSAQVIGDVRRNFVPELLERYPDVTFGLQGAAEDEQELRTAFFLSFLAALAIIYGLIAIPLKSYSQPFIIMSVIPFGAIGAIVGHLVIGEEISMFSIFGLVALTGIVVNDSLIMVDFINKARLAGMPVMQAVVESGAQRFRAIILTSVTTAAGLMPIILETSPQAQFLIPMAISVSFGIIFATVITLFLVPCLYVLQLGFFANMRRFRNFIVGRPQRSASEPV